nr:MAG TPA: hypothetical protein [Caudoviricetes sp.]
MLKVNNKALSLNRGQCVRLQGTAPSEQQNCTIAVP